MCVVCVCLCVCDVCVIVTVIAMNAISVLTPTVQHVFRDLIGLQA